MRFSLILFLFIVIKSVAQNPLYELVSLEYTSAIPEGLNASRSAVIVNVPNKVGVFTRVGDWKKIAEEAHAGFVKMNIDAIFFISQLDLTASNSAYQHHLGVFSKRKVKYLLFVTQKKDDTFEIVLTENKNTSELLTNGQSVYRVQAQSLREALLFLGKEIRRSELVQGNFLIPDKPSFLSAGSIIENTQLKNYPGQLRRSVLAVERFRKITEPTTNDEVLKKVQAFNAHIDSKNLELDSIMKSYPYDYVLIEPMSDEDLLRNRYQFLARSITGSAASVRKMLEFDVVPTETDFMSVIPIMPDKTSIKAIPKDAIVTKFYVRQNISKNVHVGEWDADVTWQSALKNMIGNLSQRLVIKN